MTTANKQKREQRWLAIRLTHFSLESLGVHRDHDNIMVSYKNRVCAATDNLFDQGIALGMPTSTAQLLHSSEDEIPCRTYERELDSEAQTLDALCQELYNYTPHIECYRVETIEGCEDVGLLLELSRCIHLFKGLTPLINHITSALQKSTLSYCFGHGHTKHITWLLSYEKHDAQLEDTRKTFIQHLTPLSIEYLYEYRDIVDQLQKTGFFTFGDLIRHIERESLHSLRKRFGEDFCNHLADILDIDTGLSQTSLFQAPVLSYHPKTVFTESIQFDYPVSNCEQLHHPVKTLLNDLTIELVKTQTQTQSVCWNLYDIHQNQESFSIRFERLHRDSKLAADLTMIQLENQPLPFEVDVLELRCEKLFPVNFSHDTINIEQQNDTEKHALATVTAKLHARLGEHAVFTLSPRDSHIPEHSYAKLNINRNIQKLSPATTPEPKTDRPSWIFNIPVKIGKRQNELFWKGKLELLQGPERIEGMWWDTPTGRDYFVAKRDDNVRLWVFHDLYKNEWFVHGVFA